MKHWKISAEGDTVYVKAPNAYKAREVVEAQFGIPAGVVHIDIEECRLQDLPDGDVWLK